MQPNFLDMDRVLRIPLSLIEHYGGMEGVRDVGLLNSALAMPQASFGGQLLHKDLFEMAAAYLFHVVQNHPFMDWNKRTGAAAAIIFLAMNDIEIQADEEGLVDLTMAVAQGKIDKPQISDFFRKLAHWTT
jgi:death on curing protein